MEGSAPEFQAVILAGGEGANLHPLCDENQPEALLTVANRPLIQFQLELLEKAGFLGWC